MIFHDRRFSRNIIPYVCRKLEKMSQKLSSAAVVIGPLRVNNNEIAPGFLGIRFSYIVNNTYSAWAYGSQGRSQNAAIVTSKGNYGSGN